MRNIAILFFLTLNAVQTFGNVNYIDISKISSDKKLVTAFNFVKANKQYYDHWTSEWNYDKPREDFTNQLREYYKDFSVLTKKNTEIYLLLGDIAHYLYNMNDEEYYGYAVRNYEEAIKNDQKDFRAYWFLAYHYALSNMPIPAIENFKKAEKLLLKKQPADFWNDYAWTTAIANMPSHCIYAMDKVKSISGKKGSFQQQFGESIYNRIIFVDKKQFYDKNDIWTANQEDKTFTSRPLGIKIQIDTIWDLAIYDYQNNQTGFIIEPSPIANKNGREIGYTIAILMKTVNDNDKLEDYVNNFVSKYTNKKKINFSDKYDKMVAYEIIDKTMYQDIGGGHLYMIGVERSEPKYSGLLLEEPNSLPQSNTDEVHYYIATEKKDRFKGKIFYLIMFDSCEDIFQQSFSIFKSLFDNQIIIE